MLKGLCVLISVSLAFSSWAGPLMELHSQESLEKYITAGKFNGVILVAKDKQVVMKKSFGFKNLNSKIPLSVYDKFLIGSNTKQFVAASILKLQEEGKLSLEDSVTKYLPSFSIYTNITIRDVLNHTSGIANFTDIRDFWKNVEYEKSLSLDDIMNFILPYPFDFEVKTNWNYSNTGYIIAGKIVETVSGKSWDQYIKDEFLIPLKMNDTGYEEFYEKVTDVDAHALDNGVLVPMVKSFNMSWALSAGALYSTVDDLLKWTDIYTTSNLLSDASKKDMQTPYKNNYGLGLMIKKYNGQIELSHGGSVPGFISSFSYLKDSKLTVITLDNVDGFFSPADSILEFFSTGKALAIKLNSYPVSNEELKDYEGTYALGPLDVYVYVENGKLYLKPNDGQPPYELVANDKDSFRLLPMNFAEEFMRNAEGKVVELKHYQNGRFSTAKRKETTNENI